MSNKLLISDCIFFIIEFCAQIKDVHFQVVLGKIKMKGFTSLLCAQWRIKPFIELNMEYKKGSESSWRTFFPQNA